MKWKNLKLGDSATFINGYAFKPAQWSDEGMEIIRIANLTGSNSNFNYFNGELPSKYLVEKGDLLISWSATLGIFEWERESGWLNQHIFKVIFNKEEFDKSFFKHLINSILHRLDREVHGSTMKHITKKRFDNVDICIPPIETQKRIASILDDAQALKQKTEKLLGEYDKLAQSIFLDMFGDPVTNPKGWEVMENRGLGVFKNGLNYKKEERGYKVKCLGVGDFQSHIQLKKMTDISEVEISTFPSEDYLLKDGDLVFVRSNGSKKLVGRCLSIYPNNTKITYSGFCIRMRTNENVESEYLTHLFNIDSFKRNKLKGARGANIQNLNQQLLGDIKLPVPPLEIQKIFVDKIKLIEQQKELAKQELKESEDLFNCLLQRAFKGELN